ncbi:MAG: hypothetical protein HOJ07_01385 [Rhodospirillaceae bacterium]|nr:hypothetical protein [Rhodospirillaceae bacterium]MBT5674316.1 hypothetical protein [Rhodospirillaceae bacterium]MBT6830945.1 hypothetical protein [Rhodospirillaceae bacterium]MBT7293319.1 hypothetical protein [Rhodospirillaceae bacterium]
MSDMSPYRARLERIFNEITDPSGAADVKGIGRMSEVNKRIDEVKDILAEMPLRLTQIEERMEGDPDFSRLSRKRRLDALADYLRFAIGLIDREIATPGGHMIVGANDD